MQKRKKLLALLGFLIITLGICLINGLVTADNIDNWYQYLVRPSYSPPNWVFSPVWSVIYILIALSAWRVYLKGKLTGITLSVFVVQMLFNFLWTFVFFGLHHIGLAWIEMSLLWLLILWNIFLFKKHDTLAAYLLIPYILWVSFAWCLNASYWWLN